MLHHFEIHSALQLSGTALLGYRLAAWQLDPFYEGAFYFKLKRWNGVCEIKTISCLKGEYLFHLLEYKKMIIVSGPKTRLPNCGTPHNISYHVEK